MIVFTAIHIKTRVIKLRLRVVIYENKRFTFWLVPAKCNCLGFISNPRRLLGDVDTEPGQ